MDFKDKVKEIFLEDPSKCCHGSIRTPEQRKLFVYCEPYHLSQETCVYVRLQHTSNTPRPVAKIGMGGLPVYRCQLTVVSLESVIYCALNRLNLAVQLRAVVPYHGIHNLQVKCGAMSSAGMSALA